VTEELVHDGTSETTRLETFCDGVFAIAITLLVLEIRVPDAERIHEAGGIWPALGGLWPSYVGYALSFLVLGIMWVNHHAMFQYIRRADRAFLVLNVLFLMVISFVPFSTGVLAEHLPEPENRRGALIFYGASMALCAVMFNAVWHSGIREGRLLGSRVDVAGLETITKRYRLGPLAYLVAIALAFVNPWVSLAWHFALAVFYVLPERSRER
jgi:uncharacterized membrane protein